VSAAAIDIDRTLGALADPQRRQTIEVLREGPRRSGDLAQHLGITAPAMSRHLRVLRRSGLVQETHPQFDARVRIYTLNPAPIAELKRWLEQTEQMWSDQLAAFKSYVEGAG
jgi:DNA-binding transcriptional ArsR family regulator